MDKYTQTVLTIIAICLIAIMIKLWEPVPAYSGFMDKGPTVGDYIDLQKLTGAERTKAREKLTRNIPIVRVHGKVTIK